MARLDKFLRNAGSRNMAVDGSVTPVEFSWGPTTAAQITRVLFKIRDGSVAKNKFAGGSELSVGDGLLFRVLDSANNVLHDFLDGEEIRALDDFDLIAGIDSISVPAAGDDSWSCRWTLEKSGKKYPLFAGQRLAVTIRADLSGITHFYGNIQGLGR